jgi:hypothetical protein
VHPPPGTGLSNKIQGGCLCWGLVQIRRRGEHRHDFYGGDSFFGRKISRMNTVNHPISSTFGWIEAAPRQPQRPHAIRTGWLGCAFLLLFLQSETPPKGILQESFSFLSEMDDSFFIFLQFGPPQKERDSFGFEGTKGFLRFPP